jgi:hypothetical protein
MSAHFTTLGILRRISKLLIAAVPLGAASEAAAQTAEDTMPERVVDRASDAFRRRDVVAYVALWDTSSYFQDLAPLPLGADHPGAPSRVRPEQRARRLQGYLANPDPRGRGYRDVLQRLVAGRFVVDHVAVWWDSPYGDTASFQKIEIYEVRNGKIVAEYDGQHVASGRPKAAGLRRRAAAP